MGELTNEAELRRLGLLAGTMGATARSYHVGFVVPDLDEAIALMTKALGVPFTAPMELPFRTLHTPEGEREVTLRLAYSTRPAHVELIESAPGTLWDFDDRVRGHHVGVWADDVAAEADRLEGLGMRTVWWATDDTGRMAFSYHETPYGFYLELVDAVARSFYPGWFAQADPEMAIG